MQIEYCHTRNVTYISLTSMHVTNEPRQTYNLYNYFTINVDLINEVCNVLSRVACDGF